MCKAAKAGGEPGAETGDIASVEGIWSWGASLGDSTVHSVGL